MTLIRTKGDKCVAFGGQLTQKGSKRVKIEPNMAVFKGRGCVTLFRTKEDKGVAFGSQLTLKCSKTVQN